METPTSPTGRRVTEQRPERLDESTCLELLRGVDVGRLAVRPVDGGVDVFPVNFVVDAGTVLIRTAAGTKLDSVANDPLVAFEADRFDWYERSAWSVVVKGEAKVVTARDDQFDLFDVDLQTWQHDHKPFFVRIVPTTITGRRFRIHRAVSL